MEHAERRGEMGFEVRLREAVGQFADSLIDFLVNDSKFCEAVKAGDVRQQITLARESYKAEIQKLLDDGTSGLSRSVVANKLNSAEFQKLLNDNVATAIALAKEQIQTGDNTNEQK